MERQRAALQIDRFGRRASEMPPSLRHLYITGSWSSYDVYLWPTILSLSVTGHHLADAADAALDRFRYHPPPHTPTGVSPPFYFTCLSSASSSSSNCPSSYHQFQPSSSGSNTTPLSITDAAIRQAARAAAAASSRVLEELKNRRKKRQQKRRHDAREYLQRRRIWMDELKKMEKERTPEVAERMKKRDRELLVATRAPSRMGASMTFREIDLTFEEIEAAGGTAGGLDRWGRSITSIPDHNPNQLPPGCDGGGVLIDNPLSYHYACRNINPWTTVERLMFLQKFLIHGKNFHKISQYFEHKSCEDVVRFYFDNKKQLNLKQLVKEQNMRKKNPKKNTLTVLSRLPKESRNMRDNFAHQPNLDFASDSDDDLINIDWPKLDPFHGDPLARSWSHSDCSSLIFALCRFDVEAEEKLNRSNNKTVRSTRSSDLSKDVNPSKKRRLADELPIPTVWSSVAAVVKSKTPRQCREFYLEYKIPLGLDGYRPPKAVLSFDKGSDETSDVTSEHEVDGTCPRP